MREMGLGVTQSQAWSKLEKVAFSEVPDFEDTPLEMWGGTSGGAVLMDVLPFLVGWVQLS